MPTTQRILGRLLLKGLFFGTLITLNSAMLMDEEFDDRVAYGKSVFEGDIDEETYCIWTW
jgi:hypothetical protein